MAPCATTDGDSKQIAREALYGESRRGLCHVKPDAAAIEASGWRLPKPQCPERFARMAEATQSLTAIPLSLAAIFPPSFAAVAAAHPVVLAARPHQCLPLSFHLATGCAFLRGAWPRRSSTDSLVSLRLRLERILRIVGPLADSAVPPASARQARRAGRLRRVVGAGVAARLGA